MNNTTWQRVAIVLVAVPSIATMYMAAAWRNVDGMAFASAVAAVVAVVAGALGYRMGRRG